MGVNPSNKVITTVKGNLSSKKRPIEVKASDYQCRDAACRCNRLITTTKNSLIELFNDWWNNFLTVERFADYYDFSRTKALRVIELGRKLHNKQVLKERE